MHIRPFIGLAVAGFMLGSCQSNSYQITGYALHLQEGDTICLADDHQPSVPMDIALVSHGKFYFSGDADSTFLCRVYDKALPEIGTTVFLEPGEIAVELNLPPANCRVSGTIANNGWQILNDSIQMLGDQVRELSDIKTIPDSTTQAIRYHAIDSLHRRMSDCILHAAARNKDNPLGQYIQENYKEPEFK